jgi:predicted  nucleic acid-binding Zn-ribbon protein
MTQELLQSHINVEHSKKIEALESHADIANKEMGLLQIDYAVIAEKVVGIEQKISAMDSRIWWILTAVVLGIVAQILIAITKL